jgi:hypothetical protein
MCFALDIPLLSYRVGQIISIPNLGLMLNLMLALRCEEGDQKEKYILHLAKILNYSIKTID